MKGVFVLLDGLGDLPHSLLDGKTPLEAAHTPNMDFFASRGEMGMMIPVRPGFVPESDEAIVSIFGNEQIDSTRGQLEAKGTDVKMARGDLAFRVNFATIDSLEKGNILDRRAGRNLTTSEAEALAKTINAKIKMPVKISLIPTIQHRAVLVFHGGFSDNISGNDATYVEGKTHVSNRVVDCQPLDEEENSQYAATVVNEFLVQSHEILKNHPINVSRRKKGFMPANYLLLRGQGAEPPKLKQYKKWAAVVYMPLEIGFAKFSGMKPYVFNYPEFKGHDAYDNLYEGLKKACAFSIKTLKKVQKNYDYVYIHIKETDLPGHDNKPLEKVAMIEYIDKTLFKFLKRFAPPKDIRVVVTGDHSTPCKLKGHSADAVPVLFYNNSLPREKHFSEKEARLGSMGKILGNDILTTVGFVK